MSCSKEDIERKRLAAIEKRLRKGSTPNALVQNQIAAKVSSPTSLVQNSSRSFFPNSSTHPQNKTGPIKTFQNNATNSFHPYAKIENKRQNENSVPIDKVVSGTTYLISEDRFEVNPSEFCTPLINIFKTIPSKSYAGKSKLWSFSVQDHDLLMSKVAPLTPHIVLGPLPSYLIKILNEQTMDPNSIDLSPIERSLRTKLMPFQEDGVRFGIAKRGRCMIADDMGLGKTFQALAIASFYRHNWPLLIVTTSSMRETWQSKIQELLPSVPLMNVVCLSGGRDAGAAADRQTEVVIASYKVLTTHAQMLRAKKFGVVVIDESHYLKSHKAQCTISMSAICRTATRVLLLSGTPALSRPQELFTQLAIIQPNLFPSYTEYGKRYCAGKITNFGWDMSGQSNLTELQILLQKKFLIRRTKDQVLPSLQEKVREAVLLDQSLLDFSAEQRVGLSQMAESYLAKKASDKHAALLTFFSESARVKIPAICKYLRQQLAAATPDCKFLVFAHHRNMVEALCLELDELAADYICITGATPASSRADLVEKFQHGRCRCAVLSLTAAGAGLTLTAASVLLFAELHWNPGILTQAEARAHRIGQQACVRVQYLLATGTADDHMWPMLQGKLNVLNEVGLSRDSFNNTTTKHQESRNHITSYLSPTCSRNINDYIPGTNIRKDSIKTSPHYQNGCRPTEPKQCAISNGNEEFEKSFLEDDEGDELLANLDL